MPSIHTNPVFIPFSNKHDGNVNKIFRSHSAAVYIVKMDYSNVHKVDGYFVYCENSGLPTTMQNISEIVYQQHDVKYTWI